MIREKILVSGHFGKFGGTRTYLINLLELLFKNDFDVVVALINKDALLIKIIRNMNFEYIIISKENKLLSMQRRIPVLRLFVRSLSNIIEYYRFKNIITNKNISFGIFSGWSPTDRFGSFILLPFRKICVVHSYPVKSPLKIMKKIIISKINENNILLTVSEFSKKSIIKYWLNEEQSDNCIVIYNGVKDGHYIFDSETNNKNILTIGHTVLYKNPILWIEIAKQTIMKYGSDINFIWAGDGDLFLKCKEEVTAKWKDNINFIGFTTEVEKLYSEAMIYLQPSRVESHGISVVDAMKHSIPCIVSDQGGLRESVRDMKEGFVISLNNMEKIVDKIGLLLEDNALRKKLGENARKRYESKFTHKLWENRTLEIIHKLEK